MNTTAPPATARPGEQPYLFAYDITTDECRREVSKCLQRWRVDGQYSVHETWMRPPQMHNLCVELTALVNRQQDSLIVCHLSQHRANPVYQASIHGDNLPLQGKPPSPAAPAHFGTGWYLVCYDVREAGRLQRIQKITAKHTLFIQRSVYLYRGQALIGLLEQLKAILQEEDDLRIYSIGGAQDMWFLSGPLPPLPGFQSPKPSADKTSAWHKLILWLRR